MGAKSKTDTGLQGFPNAYWKYMVAPALVGLGNPSNAFLILRTPDIGVYLETTILIYAAFNLVAALIIFLIAYLGFALTQHLLLIAALFVFYGAY